MKIKTLLISSLLLATTSAMASSVCVGISPEPGKFVGPVYCGAGKADSLSIRGGPVVMNGTIVAGASDIAGPLNAKSSSFEGSLLIASNILTLEGSRAKDITVKSTSAKQKVYMKSGASISGTITFEGKNGIVYVSGGSQIKDSQVIGGIVERG